MLQETTQWIVYCNDLAFQPAKKRQQWKQVQEKNILREKWKDFFLYAE